MPQQTPWTEGPWPGAGSVAAGARSEPLPRRAALRLGAGMALLSLGMAGCSLQTLGAALPQGASRPLPLQVWVPSGYWAFRPFRHLLQQALQAAAQAVGHHYTFQISFGSAASSAAQWFPPASGTAAGPTLLGQGQSAAAVKLVDDPTLKMPDLLIVPHRDVDGFLAARALDLEPYLRLESGRLRRLPTALLRQGRAYGPGRGGVIQAALPLLRVPTVCAVPPWMRTVSSGQPWDVSGFAAALQQLQSQARYALPNGPLAYVPLSGAPPPLGPAPVPGGLVNALAVGYGVQLAQTEPTHCAARFATGAAVQALGTGIGWVSYACQYPRCPQDVLPPRVFAVFMGPYGQALGLPAPGPRLPPNAPPRLRQQIPPTLPLPTAVPGAQWKLAPLPRFPARSAVPTDNVDVMVWKDTADPAAAAALAVGLLSAAAQAPLAQWNRGLAVVPELASRQLAAHTAAAEAVLLADPNYDVTVEDAFGTPTDANRAAYQLVRQDLAQALAAISGTSGGFVAPRSCSPPIPDTNQPQGQWLLILTEAQVAANSGTSYASASGAGP